MEDTSFEGMLLTFKAPDMDKLRTECYKSILDHYGKGHDNVHVQFRVCFWKRMLVVSRFIIIATDRKTNRAIKLFAGLGPIKKYVTAKWKFDHAQAHEIEWNVATFDCDGESVRMNTSMDQRVTEAAERDIRAGIVDRSLRGITQFIASIGEHIYSLTHKGN